MTEFLKKYVVTFLYLADKFISSIVMVEFDKCIFFLVDGTPDKLSAFDNRGI